MTDGLTASLIACDRPLTTPREDRRGRRIQVGVVSYGLGCGVPTFPGVYSEVNETGIRDVIRAHAGV